MQSTMSTHTLSKTSLDALKSAIETGIEAWKSAGDAIIDLIDNHGMSLADIVNGINSPIINTNVLAQFERIGRSQVLPSLLVASFPAAGPLQKLPISEQRRIMDDGTEVMVLRGETTDSLIVRPEDMTKDQVKQVFTKDGVRSLPAQRAFLEGQISAASAMSHVKSSPWVIKNGRVVFREACEMTRHDITILLTQLQ